MFYKKPSRGSLLRGFSSNRDEHELSFVIDSKHVMLSLKTETMSHMRGFRVGSLTIVEVTLYLRSGFCSELERVRFYYGIYSFESVCWRLKITGRCAIGVAQC